METLSASFVLPTTEEGPLVPFRSGNGCIPRRALNGTRGEKRKTANYKRKIAKKCYAKRLQMLFFFVCVCPSLLLCVCVCQDTPDDLDCDALDKYHNTQ